MTYFNRAMVSWAVLCSGSSLFGLLSKFGGTVFYERNSNCRAPRKHIDSKRQGDGVGGPKNGGRAWREGKILRRLRRT